jgi:hypothetical protein
MASIAEFRLPAEEFCLAETVAATDVSFDLLEVVAHDGDRLFPFVRARGDEEELSALDDLLEADPTVEAVERMATTDYGRLYRMEWVDAIESVVGVLLEEGGTILDAATANGRWRLQVLFSDRGSLSRTYEFCEERKFALTVDRIYELDEGRHRRFGLTTQQHDTMLSALEHGYYDVPREANLTDLARELDISHQALSERLRRGHGNLVESALVGTGDDEGAVPTNRERPLATGED